MEPYNELEGIGWGWQSLDGCMMKASLALGFIGKNPTDREKMGTKRSVLMDEKGFALAVVISGANTHDVKLLEETLDHIVVLRPESDENHLQICAWMLVIQAAMKRYKSVVVHPIFAPAEKKLERNPEFHARCRAVKVTHAFSIASENFRFVLNRKRLTICP